MTASGSESAQLLPSNGSKHLTLMKSHCELRIPTSTVQQESQSFHSDVCIRPCYYLLQLFGMWRPSGGNSRMKETLYKVYFVLTILIWVMSLLAVLAADFIRYGFKQKRVHISDLMNRPFPFYIKF